MSVRAGVIALATLLSVLMASSARADAARSRYVISCTLEPETHVVHGTARIRFVNTSRATLSSLFFHLYLNGFRDDDTVFMTESRGSLRGVESEGRGRIDVKALRTESGVNLLPRAHTDLLQHDRTQMRVDLVEPLLPEAALDLVIEFDSFLPPAFARTGYVDDFHMVAQWFPKLAVLEPSGQWATFPFHGMGEFYSDFADYELSVTVPTGWVVGATGRQVSETRQGSNVTRRFVVDNVHDAAWTAWPHFEERSFNVNAVAVRMLYPPGYEPTIDAHAATVRRGLQHFGAAFGPYPYETLTVVIPPFAADGAAGMEYPTLIVSAGMFMNIPGMHQPFPEYVTAHELAHEWFYGLVASNEVEWPFLDEGLTEWAGADLVRTMHGDAGSAMTLFGTSFDLFEVGRVVSTWPRAPGVPPARPAYAFSSSNTYGASVYQLTSTLLETVKRTWGRERFIRALGGYARAQRHRHPTPEDLFRAFDEAYFASFSDTYLRPVLFDARVSSTRLDGLVSRRHGSGYRTEVRAERDAGVPFPVWIALYDRDGREVTRLAWRSQESRFFATYESSEEIHAAEIDPDRHNLLDGNTLDNGKSARNPRSRPIASRIVYFLQSLLHWVTA